MTTPCPDDPGAAIDVTRTMAVMLTAIAPMTERTNCQVSDGIMCFTMPCVAWKPATAAKATKASATRSVSQIGRSAASRS